MSVKKEVVGWYFYDLATSAFTTTVTTVFFGPYLTNLAKNAQDALGFIYPLGIKVSAGSFFPYVVSLSVFLQIFILPFLGAAADYSNIKKRLLFIFAYIGAAATSLLFFADGSLYMLAGTLFLIANISFGASVVFYNAFLNDIAQADKRDEISSIGWASGYLGGGLLLLFNLILLSKVNALGITDAFAVRISLCSAGLWWAAFSVIPLLTLKENTSREVSAENKNYLINSFHQLKETLKDIKKHPKTIHFLLAFLLYNDGIQSIIILSTQFGHEELGLSMSTLATVILMVQFIAFFGALFFGRVSKTIGALKTIKITLIIWTLVTCYAFLFLKTKTEFYLMAAVIALVLGGSQALSRSVFSKLIPEGKESEYYGFYKISDKGTSWIGPLVFGLALQFTGSYRFGIFSLVVFFISGLAVLSRLKLSEETR